MEPQLLILSLVNGRDLFITLSTTSYLPSCFGSSLKGLTLTNKAVQQLSLQERGLYLGDLQGESQRKLPVELVSLTNYIVEHGMHIVRTTISSARITASLLCYRLRYSLHLPIQPSFAEFDKLSTLGQSSPPLASVQQRAAITSVQQHCQVQLCQHLPS